MKKSLLLFLAAAVVVITASAKVTTISPDAENDALRLAVHYAEDGDIIEMTEGTYVQCNNGYVAFDGKSVTVKAAEGANVVLQLQVPITLTNGGKATLQGIKIDASRLTELADWYEHVVYPTDATEGKEFVMDGCELYGFNINKSAIYSSSSNTLALCDVKNCYFHDNMKSCFFFEGESIAELSVVNSTFANIATDASGYYAGIIDVRNAAAKVTIDHCTFYNCLLMNKDYAAVTMKGSQAANVVISNNIFMLPEAIDNHRAIKDNVEATNCMTFNYVKDNGGIHSSVTKTNCFLNVDPKFVNAANGNFALADDSPALGKATDGSNLGDPRWNAPAVEEPKGITYEWDGGVLPAPAVPTQEELWASFKTATGLDTKALSELSSPVLNTIAGLLKGTTWYEGFDVLEWKWLKSYIQTIQANQAGQQFVDANGTTRTVVELQDDISSDDNWRFAVAAFFAQSQYVGWPKATADFTEAGKPENWGAAYQAAHEVVLPTEPVEEDYTLPTPVKEGYTFVGWYDNAEGTGKAYTVIPAGWAGTLYAIWKQGTTTALENIAVEGKAVKTIINGQLIIIKNGVQYNALGQVIK